MFGIRFARRAVGELKRLGAHERALVLDEIERCLGDGPQEPSRNGKELSALVPPWDHVPPVGELRVGDHRVFYDVDAGARLVTVRAVRRKGRSTTREII